MNLDEFGFHKLKREPLYEEFCFSNKRRSRIQSRGLAPLETDDNQTINEECSKIESEIDT
jgi:hypothetical protein